MRFFWLLILCLLMPAKATWAEHMGSARTDNPVAQQAAKNHHDHCADAPKGDSPTGPQQAVWADDADCGTCHAGCSAVVPAGLLLAVANLGGTLNTVHICTWAALPCPPPEKPKWHALA